MEPSSCPAPFDNGIPSIPTVFPAGETKETVLSGPGSNYPMGFERVNSVAVLTNPHSGRGSGMQTMNRALARFKELGVEAVAYYGNGPHDSRRLTREAMQDGRYDAIVVCGGDGMINLVLQETANSGFPVGIVPSGTGNDHARALAVPHYSPEIAAEIIAAGFTSTSDLGLITGPRGNRNWFGTVACVGLDADISERSNKMRWPTGAARYYAATLTELVRFRPTRYKLTLEGVAPMGVLPPPAKKRLTERLANVDDVLEFLGELHGRVETIGGFAGAGAGDEIVELEGDAVDGVRLGGVDLRGAGGGQRVLQRVGGAGGAGHHCRGLAQRAGRGEQLDADLLQCALCVLDEHKYLCHVSHSPVLVWGSRGAAR